MAEQKLLTDKVIADLSKKDLTLLEHLSTIGISAKRHGRLSYSGSNQAVLIPTIFHLNDGSENTAGLYFIGEVLDVTGWLGGYNFQWAWSSAFACAEGIIEKANN